MKDRYDFSKGKRGRVLPPQPEPEGKIRITIRPDPDILDRFFAMAEESGGTTGYQTLINAALREYLDGKAPRFEETLRCIIREELKSSAA
ncbi:MAG: BrnA antitoxin family protein [Acidobacteria bacterium]|nr:BrnA antitoxin family protein [Acidobacteriota bacterium]